MIHEGIEISIEMPVNRRFANPIHLMEPRVYRYSSEGVERIASEARRPILIGPEPSGSNQTLGYPTGNVSKWGGFGRAANRGPMSQMRK